MGEESAGVNLVAEDESELEEDEGEDEDEEWWVGTVGVMEVQDQEEEALKEMVESEPDEGTHLAARDSDSGLEEEPEYPLDTHSANEIAEDGWWSPEPSQPGPKEDEEEGQYLMRAQDPESQGEEPTQDRTMGNLREKVTAPDKSRQGQSPHPRGAKRRRLKKRVEKTWDQEWEEARQDAWSRQMLSDTSSSEDEESCGRFAESGRWISELFKISQHPAATSGGECSGQKTPDYS
jgi:hypothetical protein